MVGSKFLKVTVVAALTLHMSLVSPLTANSYDPEYGSLQELDQVNLFLGDVLKVETEWCWSSRRPSGATARKRLEIFSGNRWKPVGKTVFARSASCTKKNPFVQKFVWEVDVMGEIETGNFSGKLRMRDTAVKPSIYVQATVYESQAAYDAKVEADKRAEAERIAGYMAAFNCLVRGGEWNSQGNYCVLPPRG